MENNYGFRLQEINHNTEMCSNKDCDETTTSVSGYSNYKQRIDSMFDDTRSLISDRSKDLHKPANKRGSKSLLDNRMKLLEDYEEKNDRSISNNIQEKIEKMFEEISIHGFEKSNSFRNLKMRKRELKSPPQNQNTLSHDFKVVYLGSQPLAEKTVSLTSLQDPLRDLYFEHRRKRIQDQPNTLTISREGLKFKIKDKEHLNPFPTIAVWASVKLSFRNTARGTEYAFLPLITDPDGIDKNTLFKELKSEDKNLILGNFQGKIDEDSHSPIFTVVMKNSHLNKQLECHGFLCSSSEEAIVIAANLYQALMKKLKRKTKTREEKKNYENYNKSDAADTTTETEEEKKPPVKPVKIPPPVPSRPPRKPVKKEKEDLILELEETFEEVRKKEKNENNKLSRRGSVPDNIFTVEHEPVRTLRRSVSERRSNGFTVNHQTEGGDILTKVAIPRSQSFLNANGPLTRYSRRYKSKAHNEIISPLGLKELFNEFRLNEGLESTDDILNAIIDAEGMSFNDLKPIYKEFLLKLAVTLTKDELYQRSKIIMRRQKKKSRNSKVRKRPFISTTGISKVFRKTASKLGKPKNSRPTNLEFTSIVFQSSNKHFETSTSSTSSCGFKKGIKRRQSSRRRITKKPERTKNKKLSTTSEDSDFFMRRNTTESGGCPNRSSSGYFSCSECSYDSENCTCTSADKCYCTLGQNKKTEPNSSAESKFSEKEKSNPSLNLTQVDVQYEKDKDSVKSCGCDTESCADSEKCYCNEGKESETKVLHLSDVKGICQTPHLHQTDRPHNVNCPNYAKNNCKKHGQTIFEQLKQQGFAASDSSLSRAASPSTAWRNNEEKLRKPKECLKTSRSLEFLQIRRPETRQQMHECPPPPMQRSRNQSLEKILLKEIQNTEMCLPSQNYVEGTRHFCYHGSDVNRSFRRRDVYPNASFHTGRRRQYSSMRSRNEFAIDFSDHGTFYRGTSYRTSKNRLFSSVRSKHSCDNIMNHVLFPNANSRNSSLRFTRRMDVYNSFSKGSSINRGSYVDLLNQIETSYNPNGNEIIQNDLVIPTRHICNHEPPQLYQSSRGSDNFHKLDYDLFTSAKSETSETISNGSERKVLVVSARDPKGKVLYMGASTRGEKMNTTANGMNGFDDNAGNACEALSVKKSAEIAALFSDVSTKPKVHRSGHSERHRQRRSNSYRCTNMENTLGYLP